jgi:hypothetical protein
MPTAKFGKASARLSVQLNKPRSINMAAMQAVIAFEHEPMRSQSPTVVATGAPLVRRPATAAMLDCRSE